MNSPVSKRDIKLAFEIFGRSLYAIRVKTTTSKPAVVDPMEILELPKRITNYYKMLNYV